MQHSNLIHLPCIKQIGSKCNSLRTALLSQEQQEKWVGEGRKGGSSRCRSDGMQKDPLGVLEIHTACAQPWMQKKTKQKQKKKTSLILKVTSLWRLVSPSLQNYLKKGNLLLPPKNIWNISKAPITNGVTFNDTEGTKTGVYDRKELPTLFNSTTLCLAEKSAKPKPCHVNQVYSILQLQRTVQTLVCKAAALKLC